MATLTELLFELVEVSPNNSKIVSNEKHDSIESKIFDLFENQYDLICGNPIVNRSYLVCDEPFCFTPDLLFEKFKLWFDVEQRYKTI